MNVNLLARDIDKQSNRAHGHWSSNPSRQDKTHATDSPGRRNCFVLRTTTERQEAVDAGFAELVGVEPGKVLWRVLNWWHDGAKIPKRKSPFGDGTAAEKSVNILNKAGYC